MEEAKSRIASIISVLEGRTQLSEIFADEYCTLQLRLLCEIIALGCLTAHGDIPETKATRLRKQYKADRIISLLAGLHAEFYPRPVRQVPPDPPRTYGLEDREEAEYLTKRELIKLAGRCGEGLHRGTMHDLSLKSLSPEEIFAYTTKIALLVDIHWFTLRSGDPHYLCAMNGGRDGRVGIEVLQPPSKP